MIIKGINEELRPCPFCGGENLGFSEIFKVRCYSCGSEGAFRQRKEAAVRAWNQRATQVIAPGKAQGDLLGDKSAGHVYPGEEPKK
jgi:Lar family restriction alleviation protein